jgi:hypothetical protein
MHYKLYHITVLGVKADEPCSFTLDSRDGWRRLDDRNDQLFCFENFQKATTHMLPKAMTWVTLQCMKEEK